MVTPKKRFFDEHSVTVKIQIDNSFDLGWKRENIILATNFNFEYNGVKSITVSDNNFLPPDNPGSKQQVIIELINRGIIDKKELYWFHDLDAFQSDNIMEPELEMNEADLALCDYCWRERWNTGSMFFSAKAEDIFKILVQTMHLLKFREEYALMVLTHGFTGENEQWKDLYSPEIKAKIPKIKKIHKRIKKLNTSYNFVPFYKTRHCYDMAVKPIKVVHFHPYGNFKEPYIPSLLNFYMYGDNPIKTVFMSERLIKIFHYHGIK